MTSTGGPVVEVLGVAGAGKTTLVRALARRDRDLRVGIPLTRWRQLPPHLANAARFLPTYLSQCRSTRWFSVPELRAMAYLEAWRGWLERTEGAGVVLLDHGPLFRLATLDEFGPPLAGSFVFRRWWRGALASWAATLDLVVWLDAPDDVLLARIHAREQRHELKQAAEADASRFLARYRAAYERAVSELLVAAPVEVLRVSTDGLAAERTADEVARAVGRIAGCEARP